MAVPISKQTDRGIIVAFKEQLVIGTPESGAGAEKLRFAASPGLQLDTANVPSTESRNDGISRAAGLGRKTVTGSYNGPASLSSYDTLDKAVMRSDWTASATLAETNAGAITGIASNVVTVTNATLIDTDNLRVGMVLTPLTGFDAADIGKHCFITALTDSTMTLTPVDGSTLTAATPASWTATVNRHIIQGTTDCAFTVEQYRETIDKSETFEWVRFGSLGMSLSPDQEVQRQFTALGRDQIIDDTGSSPRFTDPTEYITEALQSARTKLVIGTSTVIGLSQFSVTLNLNPFRDDSIDILTSEIGIGQPQVSASITVMEDDLARVQSYLNGDETSVGILVEEPGQTPRNFQAVYFTKVKFGAATPSGLGADRFSVRTFPLLVDGDLRAGAYDKTMLRLSNYEAA